MPNRCVPASLAHGSGGSTGAIANQGKTNPKQQTAHDVRGELRWLGVKVDLGEVMQRKNADHTHDDCRQHNLHNGPVLKQQLTDKNMVRADAALLQKKSKQESKDDSADGKAAGAVDAGLSAWIF